jgi:hypothetical protein
MFNGLRLLSKKLLESNHSKKTWAGVAQDEHEVKEVGTEYSRLMKIYRRRRFPKYTVICKSIYRIK